MKLDDSEFSFTGSGHSDVVAAWRMRFDRMKRLQRFCGADFEVIKKEFLEGPPNNGIWCQPSTIGGQRVIYR
jgi:hypothetical protein